MSYASIINKKEFGSHIKSPAAYIVLIVFLLFAGVTFSNELFKYNQASLMVLFNIIPTIFMFIIPAIAMGTIAREKNSGTLEILTTLPLNDSDIVIGKFLASLRIIGLGLVFTFVHLITIVVLGRNIDFGPIICGYVGLFLLGAVYCAIGIFSSSLTDNQIIAFIISFAIAFFFFLLQYMLSFMPSYLTGFFQYISVLYHYNKMARGVLDTRDLIYFITLTVLFLRLAVVVMETRKWK